MCEEGVGGGVNRIHRVPHSFHFLGKPQASAPSRDGVLGSSLELQTNSQETFCEFLKKSEHI